MATGAGIFAGVACLFSGPIGWVALAGGIIGGECGR